jgi:hypothetical protein
MVKPKTMRRRKIIRIAMLAAVLTGAFLVLRSAPARGDKSCKESMEQCCKKKDANKADKLIWENLSQQFFSPI